MNAQAVLAAIDDGLSKQAYDLVVGADEKERREVAKDAIARFKKYSRIYWSVTRPDDDGRSLQQLQAAEVVVLASATLSELRALEFRAVPAETADVLLDRRPDWAQDWFEAVCDRGDTGWWILRECVLRGAVGRPKSDGYVMAMIYGVRRAAESGVHVSERDGNLAKALHDDAGLLQDEVWRLFEVEGGGENSLAAHDKYCTADWAWADTLTQLVSDGTLDRQRMLAGSLAALRRDFAPFRAGWFSRFHVALDPSADEQEALLEDYLALVASPVKPTVSFALKALTALQRAGKLPAPTLIDRIEPAMRAEAKASAKAALKLVERACKKEPDQLPRGLRLYAVALGHEATDVQEAALTLFRKYGDPSDRDLRAAVAALRDDVAPTLRTAVDEWIGTDHASGEEVDALSEPAFPEVPDDLSPAVREAAGVDDALAAGREHRLPAPVNLDGPVWPRLSGPKFEPVASVDDLLLLWSRVLEGEGDPTEYERLLDAVARFGPERPEAGPLLKQAKKVDERSWAPMADFAQLAICWLQQAPPDAEAADWQVRAYRVHQQRIRALAARAATGTAHVLYATPTHGFYVAPDVLVRRILDRPPDWELDGAELVVALLRLAPDGRVDALRAAADVSGEIGAALRFALGGLASRGTNKALWVAALRARDPHAEAPVWLAKTIGGLGPDGDVPATSRLWVHEWTASGGHSFADIKCEVKPPPLGDCAPEMPTLCAHGEGAFAGGLAPWLATTWPASLDALALAGCVEIGGNLDWWEARWDNHHFLTPWFDPDAAMGTSSYWLLALGLAAKESREHTLSVDWAVAAIEDGRLDAEQLGSVLAELLPTGVGRPQRWAKTLAEVASASTLHGLTVIAVLARALRGDPAKRPRSIDRLLEVLLQTATQHGQALEDNEARVYLTGFKGSSKAAKLAKQILASEKTASCSAAFAAAAGQAAEARVQRAERWALSLAECPGVQP